jgi:phage terminase large subunit-like protein
LLDLKRSFQVCTVLFDPYQMQSTAQRLAKAGLPVEEFPQSSPSLTAASQNLFELINSQALVAYPDEQMRLAISRAVAIETPRGWRIGKDRSSHKIDVVVALAMAAHAAVRAQGESSFDRSWAWSMAHLSAVINQPTRASRPSAKRINGTKRVCTPI